MYSQVTGRNTGDNDADRLNLAQVGIGHVQTVNWPSNTNGRYATQSH